MLTGNLVFSGRSQKEIIRKNQECVIPYPPSLWSRISPEAKSLTMQLLERDPNFRPSAAQALEHKWFSMMLESE